MPASSVGTDANSLVGMTYFRGSHYVISFTNETTRDSESYFDEYFYTALIDGLTVYQALHNLNNHISDYKKANNLTGIPDQYNEGALYHYCLGDNSLVYHLPEYTIS